MFFSPSCPEAVTCHHGKSLFVEYPLLGEFFVRPYCHQRSAIYTLLICHHLHFHFRLGHSNTINHQVIAFGKGLHGNHLGNKSG